MKLSVKVGYILTCVSLLCGSCLTACGNKEAVSKVSDEAVTRNVASEENISTSGAVKAGISVDKVEGLSEDFINGADISSYLSEIKSGAKYYDLNGKEADLFDIFKEAGINYIRLRVWNNPYQTDEAGNVLFADENGKEYSEEDVRKKTAKEGYLLYSLKDGTEVYPKGYGAGNCDIDTAVYIGKKATEHGMKVLIDFHYSDFWADPKKQRAPKAWEDMEPVEKAEAGAKYTKEALKKLRDAGVNVTMVQIGNETNTGIAGMKYVTQVFPFMKACADAVREFGKNILIAVHYTDPQKYGFQLDSCGKLIDNGVDFDVFATSYYPFWHGTNEDLVKNLKLIIEKYGKKVMVAETSYPWTASDGDGYGNSVGKPEAGSGYPASVEGQAQAIRDVIAAVSQCGENGLGVFYWEPAWIPVEKKSWNLYGSGWASKYAKGYDPEVCDDENGGTWDNQAYFDFNGKALESIMVYKYVRTGAVK